MEAALPFGAEPLLLSALALAALGIGVVALVAARSGALSREHRSLEAGRLAVAIRAQAVLDALPDPIAARDSDGRLVVENRSHASLRAEGVPRPGDGFVSRERIDRADGARWVAWAETSLDLDGQSCILQSGREITGEIAAERALDEARSRAEAASEAKSRFLATVSHEFRTPLNGILGMTGLLLDTRLDPEQATYVGAVRSSAQAFLGLIEEILDFSKIEAGRIDLADEPFAVEALVQGVVELLAPRAQGKGTEIASFVARDVPRTVRGDADRLRQVLFNIAGNAVKFTDEGGVGVSVERGDGDEIVITVMDTGPGIAPETQETIFDAFAQAGSAEARADGTGLGLAITRRLVDRMGGRIEVESALGRGSRFRITLPLPGLPAEREGSGDPAHPLAVLILSSSPFEGEFLARTLGEAGLSAVRAVRLADAVAAMERQPFDVVIADHAVPDTDIRTVAREARRRGVSRSVVLLSPFERRDFGPPHAAGFDAYLIKPVRPRSLFEQVTAAPGRSARPTPAAARPARAVTGSAPRVLLAEDNAVNALVAVRALEKLGAVVDWARDGHEALSRAEAALSGESLPFDLVLMDVRMPGLDGREVTRRIRARERQLGLGERCRIVALSASLPRGETLDGRSDFDGVLGKPFAFEALAAELARPARDAVSVT